MLNCSFSGFLVCALNSFTGKFWQGNKVSNEGGRKGGVAPAGSWLQGREEPAECEAVEGREGGNHLPESSLGLDTGPLGKKSF